MNLANLDIVILGLSITSSWGNGHATTYRALARALDDRGHRVLFLERDVPWYAENRDLPNPPFGRTELYRDLDELETRFRRAVAEADLVLVGSFVPDGKAVAAWVQRHARGLTAFYDIDTPATLAAIEAERCQYLDRALIGGFDFYLSFTGGPTLRRLEREFGARRAFPLYCSFDAFHYFPQPSALAWDLGYMGTFSADRQPTLDQLLLEPARSLPERAFVVAGPQYPAELTWPPNVERIEHLAPRQHRSFYCRQRFTLNVTRAEMVSAGYSPSVRLFEAAACGVPIISDFWAGLETIFMPGREILVARSAREVMGILASVGEDEAQLIGARARRSVLARHTADHRAEELESYLSAVRSRPSQVA